MQEPSATSATLEQDPPQRRATIYCVANQKGGVGKTTTSVSLAAALAEAGAQVLLIDLDPQGNATTGLGLRAQEGKASSYHVLVDQIAVEDATEATAIRGLHIVPGGLDLAGAEIELVPAFSREMRLRKGLDAVRDLYDVVIIDCPPTLGLLTINALSAADAVLLPIQCEYYALEGVGQLTRSLELIRGSLNPNLVVGGVLLTMFDARTNLSQQVADNVREYFGDVVYDTVIPRTVRLSEAPGFGEPITTYDPTSKGARAYKRLAREVAARLGLDLGDHDTTEMSALDRLLHGTAESEAAAPPPPAPEDRRPDPVAIPTPEPIAEELVRPAPSPAPEVALPSSDTHDDEEDAPAGASTEPATEPAAATPLAAPPVAAEVTPQPSPTPEDEGDAPAGASPDPATEPAPIPARVVTSVEPAAAPSEPTVTSDTGVRTSPAPLAPAQDEESAPVAPQQVASPRPSVFDTIASIEGRSTAQTSPPTSPAAPPAAPAQPAASAPRGEESPEELPAAGWTVRPVASPPPPPPPAQTAPSDAATTVEASSVPGTPSGATGAASAPEPDAAPSWRSYFRPQKPQNSGSEAVGDDQAPQHDQDDQHTDAGDGSEQEDGR